MKKTKKIRVVLDVTPDLHRAFRKCSIRKGCNTDAEGIRAAMRISIDRDRDVNQEKNPAAE